jgi:hypothetical protein
VLCLDYGYMLASAPRDLTRPQINFLIAALSDRIEKMSLARADREGVNKIVFVDDEDEEIEPAG